MDAHKAMNAEMQKLFKATALIDVIGKSKKLITLKPSTPCSVVIKTLWSNKIRSVILAEPKDNLHMDKISFVDYIDIVSYLLSKVVKDGKFVNASFSDKKVSDSFFKTAAKDIANHSQRLKFGRVKISDNLFDGAMQLVKGSKRVAVVDDKDHLVNILTHTDCIGFLQKHAAEQKPKSFKNTIAKLHLGSQVISVSEDVNTVQSLLLMHNYKFSALPIIADDGFIVSVLSCRDIKVLLADDKLSLQALAIPALDFVKIARKVAMSSSTKAQYPFFWCKTDSTVELVINRIAATHVHRLVIVNEKKEALGVVSASDLLAYLLA